MESHISATDAARRFSDLLNRVYYRNEEFVVERGGQPVCRMVPARPGRFTLADLAARLASLPKPDKGYWDAVESASRNQPPVPKSVWPR